MQQVGAWQQLPKVSFRGHKVNCKEGGLQGFHGHWGGSFSKQSLWGWINNKGLSFG